MTEENKKFDLRAPASKGLILSSIVMFVIAAAVVGYVFYPTPALLPEKSTDPNHDLAMAVCELSLKNQLKTNDLSIYTQKIRKEEAIYVVAGNIESSDHKKEFTCNVRYLGGDAIFVDSWKIEQMDLK